MAQMLISEEEVYFQNTYRELSAQIVQYVRNMEETGHINADEKRFLMEGVVFKAIKLAEGMRPDILHLKELQIKSNHE